MSIMSTTIVDRLYDDFIALAEHLGVDAEPSLCNTADECFRKTLLLAAGSYFEVQIITAILEFIKESSNGNNLAIEFVRSKALSRQYHTLFNWDAKNANQFYGLFGEKFKEFMKMQLENNEDMNDSISAFLEVGSERNRLVHQDFGTYTLEKTAKEIFALYQRANLFVINLKPLLVKCGTV